jgi:hypothetical protein
MLAFRRSTALQAARWGISLIVVLAMVGDLLVVCALRALPQASPARLVLACVICSLMAAIPAAVVLAFLMCSGHVSEVYGVPTSGCCGGSNVAEP